MSEVKRINLALQGWADGGRAGARASLRTFWTELGSMAISSPIQRTPLDRLQGHWNLDDLAVHQSFAKAAMSS